MMYENEKNLLRVFEIYKLLFELKREIDLCLCSIVNSRVIDELEMY